MTITGWEAVSLAGIMVAAIGALYFHARRDYVRKQQARRSQPDLEL